MYEVLMFLVAIVIVTGFGCAGFILGAAFGYSKAKKKFDEWRGHCCYLCKERYIYGEDCDLEESVV